MPSSCARCSHALLKHYGAALLTFSSPCSSLGLLYRTCLLDVLKEVVGLNDSHKFLLCVCRCQEVDLFGEVGGISFSPDSSSFFISIADVAYSSLQEYVIADGWRRDDGLVY